MNRDDITRMAREAHRELVTLDYPGHTGQLNPWTMRLLERFAALVAAAERNACISIIQSHLIPVGNSASGEMACRWTYDALHEIRDDIRERGRAELDEDGWRRCAVGQKGTQHCALLEAAVLAEREALAADQRPDSERCPCKRCDYSCQTRCRGQE